MKFILNNNILGDIINQLDEGIHVIDIKGETILYNNAMAKLEGLEIHDVINKHIFDIFPSLDESTSTLYTVMKTGRPIINKVQSYLNYNGEKIVTMNTTMPLFEEGKKVGAFEIAQNITEIKELSERLVDLKQELININNRGNNKAEKEKKYYTFEDIIGNSELFKRAIDIGRKASETSSNVFIYGETGTGKELFAQSIHYSGIRSNEHFVAQNCAALPESLLESILFGTVKGSFTGAVDRAGLFEQAHGGTLLLDEINSMGLNLQAKLLRVIQEGYIRRVGGLKDIPVDVRIIATTNESPEQAIDQGKIRRDLFYRLNVVFIEVPLLKDRIKDIRLLSEYFIKKFNKLLDKNVWIISENVFKIFEQHSWPGNVRELQNVIEGAMNLIRNDEHVIKENHLPPYINKLMKKKGNILQSFKEIDVEEPLPNIISQVEKEIILKRLEENDYNISKAARSMKIKRQTLQHKLKKYEIFI